MRVVFMGTPEFAVPSLKALLDSRHEVVGVVTQPDRPRGRGKAVMPSPIKALAQAEGIPVLQPAKMKDPDFLDALKASKPEVIVVVAFGRILPASILALPPRGCINVHASLLPRYRGAAPIQWALIRGETHTGVTTMLMDEGMDTGPILLQEVVPIAPDDTTIELSRRLAEVGGRLLLTTLREWEAGGLVPRPQNHAEATMAPMLKKEDGLIDWTLSAEEIANRVRGLVPWPGAYTFYQESRLTIWKAKPQACDGGKSSSDVVPGTILAVEKAAILVATGNGVLAILEIQPANRKRMTVQEFLAGHRLMRGERLSAQPAHRSS
ncbi:MAG: methionyl-tRNA formyltransferase [Nitrospirae bacterium]|nr:MAG: methionyl-tRNA formyltransferase [Nitrospirota bacterium]